MLKHCNKRHFFSHTKTNGFHILETAVTSGRGVGTSRGDSPPHPPQAEGGGQDSQAQDCRDHAQAGAAVQRRHDDRDK